MELPIYQIDAFTNHIFEGNPAAVVPLTNWLPDHTMLQIAQENALAETAFYIDNEDHVALRWFTPEIEMDLCGHATLATAHCLFKHQAYKQNPITFETKSGALSVLKQKDQYQMELPRRPGSTRVLPTEISHAISIQPQAVYKARDYLLIYEHQQEIRDLQVDKGILDQINLDPGGVIVSAPGLEADFVSRFFTPQASILEDPVTGSAHCTLIPYWAQILNKKKLLAWQLSKRGGVLSCEDRSNTVLIAGNARTYLQGNIIINSL